MTGKSFHTWSRSKESCHYGFFGVSSSLKSKKTTSYIWCSQKAPFLGGSSHAFVRYCFGRTTLYRWGNLGQFAIFFAADTDFEDLAGTGMAGQFEVQSFQVVSYFVAKSVAEIVAQAVEDLELGLQ